MFDGVSQFPKGFRIGVCGSRGFLGRRLVMQALDKSFEVVAFARTAESMGGQISTHGLDFASQRAWDAIPACMLDVVVYVAGRAHLKREDGASQTELVKSNVIGVKNALDFARRCGARRFVLASSISVYDFSSEGSKTEDSPCHPVGQYGESKLAGERICLDAGDLEVVVVQLATLFGPGDIANIYGMVRAIKARRFFIPGRPQAQKSVLPVDLAAEIILRLAEEGGRGCSVLNAALPEAPSLREICDVFEEVCGFRRVPSLGPIASVAAGWAGDVASVVWRGCPFNSAVRRKISQSTVVSTDRLYATLDGLRPKPFVDWMRDYADYYRLK